MRVRALERAGRRGARDRALGSRPAIVVAEKRAVPGAPGRSSPIAILESARAGEKMGHPI